MYDKPVNKQNLYSICSNINYDNYDIYTQYIKEHNVEDAVKEIIKVYNDGYSVIDIFIFIIIILKQTKKYQIACGLLIISLLCSVISLITIIMKMKLNWHYFTNKSN